MRTIFTCILGATPYDLPIVPAFLRKLYSLGVIHNVLLKIDETKKMSYLAFNTNDGHLILGEGSTSEELLSNLTRKEIHPNALNIMKALNF